MTTLERTRTVQVPGSPSKRVPPTTRSVVAIEFPDVFRAHEAMLAAARLERRLSIVLNDAAVITRSAQGRVRVNRGGRPTPIVTATWAAAAAAVPTSLLFGPWIALGVAAVASVAAALWARRAVGLLPSYLRRIGADLTPGRAAGCFLVSHGHKAHVLEEVRRFDGLLLHSTLPDAVHDDLVEALASH